MGMMLESMFRPMLLVRCYTCNIVFDLDKRDQKEQAKRHSRECHEMTSGFHA
jgi:hypothetical protein